MPTYEYECLACRQRFERKQSFSEEPVKVCPSCGGEVRRVLHAPGLVFKGSGWYVTDSRKSTEPSAGEKSDPAAAASSSADGAGSAADAKPGPAEAGGAGERSKRARASRSSADGSSRGPSGGGSGGAKAS
ncbi:MAG TPA: FmdB family zinc ribbon protein [Chloroflexota bacterium]|jgi:putative FmdB family regulatory protein